MCGWCVLVCCVSRYTSVSVSVNRDYLCVGFPCENPIQDSTQIIIILVVMMLGTWAAVGVSGCGCVGMCTLIE